MNKIHSLLYPFIIRQVELKQALGYGYKREQTLLLSLEQFLIDNNERDLNAGNFAGWCNKKEHLSPTVLRRYMSIARNLCLYRQRFEPECFIPDKHLFPEPNPPIRPFLFSDAQINCLLKAADHLPVEPISPIRTAVFHLAIVLLYTSGLRSGELLRLTVGDYESGNQILTINNTKLQSTRYLPLSTDAIHEMDTYLSIRRKHNLSIEADTPLIGHLQCGGRAYTATTLRRVLQQLCCDCKIYRPDGHFPRVHDFRHCFAVHALLRWYRQGDDPQAKLPQLATYMGHVSIVSTEYYLPFIDELAGESSKHFATAYGKLVQPSKTTGEKL